MASPKKKTSSRDKDKQDLAEPDPNSSAIPQVRELPQNPPLDHEITLGLSDGGKPTSSDDEENKDALPSNSVPDEDLIMNQS